MTIRSAKDLVAEANDLIETLSGEAAVTAMRDQAVLLVDVRKKEELEKTGKVTGALHVPRGLLEFQADPTSPMHKHELGSGRRFILYCGSGSRSAPAAKTLKDMGLEKVAHVAGGFPALQGPGAPIEGQSAA